MAITRAPRPQGNFYILDKSISEDRRLSWAARGMLIYLLGKPDHWQVSVASLINETADCRVPSGRDAVRATLRDLMDAGYIQRTVNRGPGGKVDGYQYLVSEIPNQPETDLPETAQPAPVNPLQVSTDLLTSTDTKKMADKSADAIHAFDQFWNAGLRKLKRKDAETAFMREFKKSKMPAADFGQMLADDVAERLRLEQFGFAQLHPTTYLNGQRWNDEKVNDAKATATQAKPDNSWQFSDQGITRKAAELGIIPRPSESYRDLADRIRAHLDYGSTQQAQPEQPELLIDDADIPY